MKKEDYEFVIFKSFDYLPTLQTYLESERNCFELTRGDFACGLKKAFERIKHEVNVKDYKREAIIIEGETIEIKPNDIKQKKIIEGLKYKHYVSPPWLETIDLNRRTNGELSGIVTADLMETLWPYLNNYLQLVNSGSGTPRAIIPPQQKDKAVEEKEDLTIDQINSEQIQKNKYIIEPDNKLIQRIFDHCNPTIFECEYMTFRECLENANFHMLRIKHKNKVQYLTYMLSSIMNNNWYTDICQNMDWTKSLCSGKRTDIKDQKWTKGFEKILSVPKKE